MIDKAGTEIRTLSFFEFMPFCRLDNREGNVDIWQRKQR